MQRYQQQPKTPQQLHTKFVSIGSSLIEVFFKSKMTMSKKDTIQSIKKYSQFNRKRTELFVRSISKIISKKQLNNKKHVIGCLLENRISQILLKRQKLSQLKINVKKNSLTLISSIFLRNLNDKIRQSFSILKTRSSFKFLRQNYKLASLSSSIKKVQRGILSDALKKVKIQSFRRLSGYKRCFVLQRLYLRKRVENLVDGFNNLFEFSLQQSSKISEERQTQQQSQSQQVIIDQLQSQHNQLQTKLQQLNSQSSTLLQQQQTQLTTLQQQLQSIRFQYDLNLQDNTQLQQTLKQRQNHKVDAQFTTQKGEFINAIGKLVQLGANNKRLSQQTLWQRLFNNLLLYLVKCQKSKQQTNDYTHTTGQTFQQSQQKLLQALTQPLIETHIYPTLSELIQQNNVLKQLLKTYQQSFPEITLQKKSINKLPTQILLKQRLFLIRSLECLSKWGTQAGDGLEGLKNSLEKIKARKQLQY